jgi:C4-type Zn-finger protein
MNKKFDYDKPVMNCPACKSRDLSVVMRYLEKENGPVLEEGVHCNNCGFSFAGTIKEEEDESN